MSRLLCEVEIDLACAEYLHARGYSVPQPVIVLLEYADELDELDETLHAMGEKSPLRRSEHEEWVRRERERFAVGDMT